MNAPSILSIVSIFVACAHGLHIPFGRSMPTVALECHALVDEDQGLFYRLWRILGAVSFQWEMRYVLHDLDLRSGVGKWFRKNDTRAFELAKRYQLPPSSVTHSRDSHAKRTQPYFSSSPDNKETLASTAFIIALYANSASNTRAYTTQQLATCSSRLRWMCDIASETSTVVNLPLWTGSTWAIEPLVLHRGKWLDLQRLRWVLPEVDSLSSADAVEMLVRMADLNDTFMESQAPSLVTQLAELTDAALDRLLRQKTRDGVPTLPCLRGPSGRNVRRVDAGAELFLSTRRQGVGRAIRQDTSRAVSMSATFGGVVDRRACSLYAKKVRETFQGVHRVHIAVGGARYSKREMTVCAVHSLLRKRQPSCTRWLPTD